MVCQASYVVQEMLNVGGSSRTWTVQVDSAWRPLVDQQSDSLVHVGAARITQEAGREYAFGGAINEETSAMVEAKREVFVARAHTCNCSLLLAGRRVCQSRFPG